MNPAHPESIAAPDSPAAPRNSDRREMCIRVAPLVKTGPTGTAAPAIRHDVRSLGTCSDISVLSITQAAAGRTHGSALQQSTEREKSNENRFRLARAPHLLMGKCIIRFFGDHMSPRPSALQVRSRRLIARLRSARTIAGEKAFSDC